MQYLWSKTMLQRLTVQILQQSSEQKPQHAKDVNSRQTGRWTDKKRVNAHLTSDTPGCCFYADRWFPSSFLQGPLRIERRFVDKRTILWKESSLTSAYDSFCESRWTTQTPESVHCSSDTRCNADSVYNSNDPRGNVMGGTADVSIAMDRNSILKKQTPLKAWNAPYRNILRQLHNRNAKGK